MNFYHNIYLSTDVGNLLCIYIYLYMCLSKNKRAFHFEVFNVFEIGKQISAE